MKCTVVIEMDNTEFDEDCAGIMLAETLRILANNVSLLSDRSDCNGERFSARDINGNKIGTLKIE